MRPINPLVIALWVVASAAVGFGYSQWAVNNGLTIPISGVSLGISIFVIAVILLVATVPIWRYKKNLITPLDPTKSKALPLNPFYAYRVLLLAKSGAITAAIFLGWHAGVLIKQYTAPVIVPEAMSRNFTAAIASIVLLIVAFIVEQICKLPKDDKNTDV